MSSPIDLVLRAGELPTVTVDGPAPSAEGSGVVIGITVADGQAEALDPRNQLDARTRDSLTRSAGVLAATWADTASVVNAPGSSPYDYIVLVGLDDDDPSATSAVRLRRAAGAAARASARIAAVTFALPVSDAADVRAIIEGSLLGGFVYPGLHREAEGGDGGTVEIDVLAGGMTLDPAEVTSAVEAARATRMTRTLVDLPPNLLYPASFAKLAGELADRDGLDVKVWDEAALRGGGFGGLVGVGQGSEHGPALVRVDYTPQGSARSHLAFVGKGITYDSGGINLKLSELDYMNFDMSGAAAVLTAVLACARLQVPVRVTAWLALAENVPSGTSQRPSDVITLRDGTTVEVRDTDAEGRLVLADAIIEATAEGPDIVVDIATLTGAQQIALGDRVSGMMANDDDLAGDLSRLATAADERVWRMPLPVDLGYGLRSRVADIANKAERPGGMLTAALFLQHFVSRADAVPRWGHLDICGPAINRAKPYGFTPLGSTGVGSRTLIALAEDVAASAQP
ncbi:leucyl aminopeptidase [Microbacterium sp. GCS4]|uniref:leucyl aminopeptidase n=1 Tax=Microbacterium sp. GCS4 TaxID=1692239 RepID=UPI000680D0B6|nr:leucyl aminopeptidase [Microbacterium sp. GCS4]KNY04026.1 hypothetical protein AKH00_16785 [Microbacterium sp. GCS4]